MPEPQSYADQYPEYFALIGVQRHAIDAEWMRLNRLLSDFRAPSLFQFLSGRRLDPIRDAIKALEHQYAQWDKNASEIIGGKPHLIPAGPDPNGPVFFNNLHDLQNLGATLASNMQALNRNFERIKSDLRNQLNFNVAICSFAISFLGLLISLAALLETIAHTS